MGAGQEARQHGGHAGAAILCATCRCWRDVCEGTLALYGGAVIIYIHCWLRALHQFTFDIFVLLSIQISDQPNTYFYPFTIPGLPRRRFFVSV
jgi:hypothetical protein